MSASVYSIDDLKLMPRRKRARRAPMTGADRLRVIVPMDKSEREREEAKIRADTEKFLQDMLRLHLKRMIATIGYEETMFVFAHMMKVELKPKETAP